MKKLSYYLLLISLPAASAVAVDFPSARSGVAPFSQYGMIQNVQSYSSNPFYDMNGQYNQRTVPIIVDATGEEISTAECQYTVRALINSYCGYNNNCSGMKIDDIKPAIIVQLSNMNGNYINACNGYIDTAFDNYKSENYIKPNVVTGFPTPTYINKNTNSGNAVSFPEMSDVEKKTYELESLQNQNGANDYKLTATEMPKTINDVSFTDQIANKTAGYEKWKAVIDEKTGKCIKNCAYQTPDIESREETYKRQTDELTEKKALDKLSMSHKQFCDTYPNEPECTQQKTDPVVTPPAPAAAVTNKPNTTTTKPAIAASATTPSNNIIQNQDKNSTVCIFITDKKNYNYKDSVKTERTVSDNCISDANMSIRRILSSNDYFFGLKTGILSDSWFSDTPYDFKETDKAVNTVNKLIKILSAEENCSGNSIFLLEKGTNRVIAGPYVIR